MPTKLTVTATGYYSQNVIAIANRLTDDTVDLESVVLEKLPANKITLSITKTMVKKEENEPVKAAFTSVNEIEFKVKNITTGNEISQFEVQYPDIIIGNSVISAGDVIEITATHNKNEMVAESVRVTLDQQKMGSCKIEFVENGHIEVTGISGNPENYVFVFDSKGDSIGTYYAKSFFTSGKISADEYTLVFIKKTSYLRNLPDLSRLDLFGLDENTDYVIKKITVNVGEISKLDGVIVPVLDENKLSYTVPWNTGVSVGNPSAVVGKYITIRAEYQVDSKYNSHSEKVTIELPEGILFAKNSLTVDGKVHPYSTEGNKIDIATNKDKAIVRFYVLATEVGNYNIDAYLSLNTGGEAAVQPIGTASVKVSSSKIEIPKETNKKHIVVSGATIPNSEVTVYDNDVEVATVKANKAGSWFAKFDLVEAGDYSIHYIYAKIKPQGYPEFVTEENKLIYNVKACQVSKITMLTGGSALIFDFEGYSALNPAYSYVQELPDFTFKVEFSGDSSELEDVYVVTENSDGSTAYIPMTYDDDRNIWLGTRAYLNPSALPRNVGVEWNNVKSGWSESVVPTDNTFSEMLNDIREAEQFEKLIEEESKKENPDFDAIFGEDESELTQEEMAELDAKYLSMSDEELLKEFEEAVAMIGELADETAEEPDDISYSTNVTFEAMNEELGGMVNYTMKDCSGIQESELEANGYVKYNDTSENVYYVKMDDWYYSYVNFNEDIFIETGFAGASELTEAELLSDDAVAMWREVAEKILGYMENFQNTMAAIQAKWEMQAEEAYKRYEQSNKTLKNYEYAMKRKGLQNKPQVQKRITEAKIDEAYLKGKYNNVATPLGKFSAAMKVSPVFQVIALVENIALNLLKYCDLYDSTMPCEGDPEKAEQLRNDIYKSGSNVCNFCVATGVLFIVINPATPWGALAAIAANMGVSKLTNDMVNKDMAKYTKRLNDLECESEDEEPGGDDGGSSSSGQRDVCQIIDPSGYVYEAVPSNRVEGVKAECYYYDYPIDDFGMPGENKEEILWDAAEYDQVNPLYTDKDGRYAWDVPPGEWLVKFSKEGYYDADSRNDVAANANGYLPVPPPQTEVNTAIVSKAAPTVRNINVYNDEVQIIFSQYMQLDTVNTNNIKVMCGGKEIIGTILPDNAEYDYNGENQYASIFTFTPSEALSGNVTVEVRNARNYAGTMMVTKMPLTQKANVKPEGLSVNARVDVPYNSGALLEIEILPKEAGANKTLTISTSSPSIVGVVNTKVTTDENGKANVMLSGNLPGEGEISISLDGTDISTKARATVGNVVSNQNKCAKVTANIASGSTVEKGTAVMLSTQTEGAEIYYTLDGTCPCVENNPARIKYTEPIVIDEYTFLIAYAVKPGMEDGSTAGFTYVVQASGNSVTPLTSTSYVKTQSGYDFNITCDSDISGKFLCVAIYNSDGKLLELKQPELDGTYKACFDTNEAVAYAKVFVWGSGNNLIPEAKAEIINITN